MIIDDQCCFRVLHLCVCLDDGIVTTAWRVPYILPFHIFFCIESKLYSDQGSLFVRFFLQLRLISPHVHLAILATIY